MSERALQPAGAGHGDRPGGRIGGRARLALAGLLVLASAPAAALEHREFTTAHGLRVWLLPQDDAATVSLVLHVPVGSADDPAGKEGLAHFVEHMLFTDNDGRDELVFFKELKSHGGDANGRTTRDGTFFQVEAPAPQTALVLDWTRRLLLDHTFDADAAAKEREIVLFESGLTPPEPLDYLIELVGYLDLETPDFWEREFGIVQDDRPVGGTWASVRRIRLADLQRFYDRHYRLDRMTLFLVGGFDPAWAEARIREIFVAAGPGSASFAEADGPPTQALVDPGTYRQEVTFAHDRSLRYENVLKLYDVRQEDVLALFFLRDFLREYLNDELRFRERFTYGVTTSVSILGSAAYLEIDGRFARGSWREARAAIDGTLEALERETLPPAEFAEYRERAKIVHQLTAKTPELRARNFATHYFQRAVFDSYPDVEGYYETVTPEEIGAFARRLLVPEHRVRRFTLAALLPAWVETLLTGLVAVLVLLWLRRHWLSRLDLRQIRYVRKFYYPIPQRLLFWAVGLIAYLFYQEVLVYVHQHVAEWYVGMEGYWTQLAIHHVVIALWLYLSALPFTLCPHKLLLMTDGLVVKFWLLRSWWVPWGAVERLEVCRGSRLLDVRGRGAAWPLTLGLLAPALYLEAGRLRLFFRTRDDAELAETFERLRHAAAVRIEPKTPAPAPLAPTGSTPRG